VSGAVTTSFHAPMVLRGQVIDSPDLSFGGRRGEAGFTTPDAALHVERLALGNPSALADLYTLSFDDILDYLKQLGDRLDIGSNVHLQAAFEMSSAVSGLSTDILSSLYRELPRMVQPDVVRAVADRLIGIDYLEGWVPQPGGALSPIDIKVRAFGARCVHIVAGNVPTISVQTMVWNAITRSDALVKTPSNDPLTAVAIARTMVDMAPDHPVTKHFSAGYWKGGDERIEEYLYDPRRIEKIVAWGGFAGIKHVTKYLQPGLDLITLNPKQSSTIVGVEAFDSEETLRTVAGRLAMDIGALNQEACFNARVVYVVSGTDAQGLERASRLGKATFAAIQALPPHLSTPHKAFPAALREEIDNLRYVPDEFELIGATGAEGGVIVSQTDSPVDFSASLACRVCNIVPIDDVEVALRSVTSYTQTVGIFPPSLKAKVRDRLAFQGAQRIVALGGATLMDPAAPQDGIEPLRRICKWIVEEDLHEGVVERMTGAHVLVA
jgi:acyl-CoA reductase LuxC